MRQLTDASIKYEEHMSQPANQYSESKIQNARLLLGSLLISKTSGLVAIVGPCAQTDDYDTINHEGDLLIELEDKTEGLMTLHRLPPWKPRTNPLDWKGLETTDQKGARDSLLFRTRRGDNLAIEVGMMPHIKRYANLLTMAWIGGRNVDNDRLVSWLALDDESLVIGVKNGLDGNLGAALHQIGTINDLRRVGSAPAVLIYRGGDNAKSPDTWEKMYLEAHKRTRGRLIVDTAHGSEMAHTLGFKKSVEGQLRAIDHVISLAKDGYIPRGIMMEASDASSPTDPNIPFSEAIRAALELSSIVESTNR